MRVLWPLFPGYESIRYSLLHESRAGETVKTCRQVGAHRKEKQRNGTEFVRKEYQKVYNRLRRRKNREVISVDEWNRQVAVAQDLKAEAIGGKFSDAELMQRFDEM